MKAEVVYVRSLGSLYECIWRDCSISDVLPFSVSAAAWTHDPNARKKRIIGENFISDVGLGSGVG